MRLYSMIFIHKLLAGRNIFFLFLCRNWKIEYLRCLNLINLIKFHIGDTIKKKYKANYNCYHNIKNRLPKNVHLKLIINSPYRYLHIRKSTVSDYLKRTSETRTSGLNTRFECKIRFLITLRSSVIFDRSWFVVSKDNVRNDKNRWINDYKKNLFSLHYCFIYICL